MFFLHNFNPNANDYADVDVQNPTHKSRLNSFSAKHSKSINQLAQLVYAKLSLLDIKDIKVR